MAIGVLDRIERRFALALTVGYAALTAAVVSAHRTPTTGFEVSIYGGTPIVVWGAVGLALTLSLLASVHAPRSRFRIAGLGLGGGSAALVVALPLVRGYRFYGAGDGLTHIGWANDIAHGTLNPFGLFYPGLHTVTVFLARLAGIERTRAMLLAVCAFALLFVSFVPLCVRAITDRAEPVSVGVFVAALFLPVNHVATHYMEPHPITEAILFSPVVCYLLVQYLLAGGSLRETPVSTVGVLLGLALIALVVYHPQQAANTLVFFCVIAATQAVCRFLDVGGRIRAHRPLYAQTTLLASTFAVWTTGRETFAGALGGVVRELAGLLFEGGSTPASVVDQRGGSLAEIGASTTELFAKLLSVSALFCTLAGLLVLLALLGRDEKLGPETTALVRYFGVGLAAIVPYSLAFFVGSVSKLFFRNLGFMMAIVTVLGAIALCRCTEELSERVSPAVGRPALTLLLGAALVCSTVVVYPSPYVYIASGHVTDDRLSGYETTFAHQDPAVEIHGIRGGPWRFRHALVGVTNVSTSRYEDRSVSGANLTRLRTVADEDRYLVVTRPDVIRETEVYNGLRYSGAGFASIERQPGVSRVQSNGDYTLYYVKARSTGPADRFHRQAREARRAARNGPANTDTSRAPADVDPGNSTVTADGTAPLPA